MDVSFPAFAQRVTVLGSTRNIVATSAGVSSGSASGVRADICTASPPGPLSTTIPRPYPAWLPAEPAVDVLYMAHLDHIAITSGDKSTTRSKDSGTHCPGLSDGNLTLRNIANTHCRYHGSHGNRGPAAQLAFSSAASACQRLATLPNIAVAISSSPLVSALIAADTSATDWSARSASSSSRLTRPP